jgi:hypothetical protein
MKFVKNKDYVEEGSEFENWNFVEGLSPLDTP